MNQPLVRRRIAAADGEAPEHLTPVPEISRFWLALFGKYSESYLRRHFHAVRLLANSAPSRCDGLPLVVYLNHSAWWDPIVSLLLARHFFPRRDSYGPIDAESLTRYPFFRRLGFFGVKLGTRRGAKDFLQTARTILQSRRSALFITPQGKFADFHARPVQLERGLSHLPRHIGAAAFLPLAIQYVHWEERLPEILLAFGEPIVFDSRRRLSTRETARLFEVALATLQDHLGSASQRRNADEWRTISRGNAGVNFFYDCWREVRARLRGDEFERAHSRL
ncbi:MAG: lysophospholipid acyltransferase family protein [Verrucomicrobiota bacterium]|nr:lysophospholipid acyltransferase family protein [Verrucomicrobiota bacterium]